MSFVDSMKTAIGLGSRTVSTSGTITDVFGHRFVVAIADGKVLADIGPEASETIPLAVGAAVTIEGERKPTEIKVARIAVGDLAMRDTGHAKPHKEHDKHAAPFGPNEAAAMARADGYELLADLKPHKKHFEGRASKNGRSVEIHVHRDGVHEH